MKFNKQKLIRIMEEKEMNQSDVSKKLGCSRQNFNIIFNRGTCAFKTLVVISKALGVPVSELIVEDVKESDLFCPITRSLCIGSGCAWWMGDGGCAASLLAFSLEEVADFLHTDSLHVVNYEGT